MKRRGYIRFISSASVWVLLMCCILLLVKNPALSSSLVKKGFDICARSVIPAIFPFAVIGALLCRLEAPKAVSRLVSWLFGVGKEASGAVISGLLSGFPVGGMCAFELYGKSKISKEETERIICFTNNPSAAFVIGYVGLAVLGSVKRGVILYIILLLVSLVVANLQRRKKKDDSFVPLLSVDGNSLSLAEVVAAVKNSALTMLTVSAFIIAFSVIGGYINIISSFLPDTVRCLLCGAVEISNGINTVKSSYLSGNISFILSGAICAFSGMSVHMQVASLNVYPEISMKKYYISKAFASFLTALLCALVCRFI